MNNKGYFVVHEWMVTDLGLKGTELLVYAIIYGFTQIEEQKFYGSRRYLSNFIGASISSIQRSLDYLVEKGYLIKSVEDIPVNGVRMVSYRANLDPQYQNESGVKMTHNNTIDSIGIKEGSTSKGMLVRKRNVASTDSTAFDIFWRAYPRHVAKQNAVRAFAKLNPNDELLSIILKDIKTRKSTEAWKKDGGQFIPHPATYLNGKRWEDDIPVDSTPKNAPASFSRSVREETPNWGDD